MSLQILKKFKTELLFFFDELIECFPEEGGFIIFRIMLKDQLDIKWFVDKLIEKLLPQKDEVKKRNDSFFIEYGFNIFNKNKNKVNTYANLWKELDDTTKETIWSWYDSFIQMGELYVKTLKEENK